MLVTLFHCLVPGKPVKVYLCTVLSDSNSVNGQFRHSIHTQLHQSKQGVTVCKCLPTLPCCCCMRMCLARESKGRRRGQATPHRACTVLSVHMPGRRGVAMDTHVFMGYIVKYIPCATHNAITVLGPAADTVGKQRAAAVTRTRQQQANTRTPCNPHA